MKEFGGIVGPLRGLKSEGFGAAVESFIDCLAEGCCGGIGADGFNGWSHSSAHELYPGVCKPVLGAEDSDSVAFAGVARVGVAKNEDGVAD